MALGEFDIIRRYFTDIGGPSTSLVLGVGDDCALFELAAGEQLAVTTDTLVAGVHFPHRADPRLVARRALRVNLSDLAAMAAVPLGCQLALTLIDADESWLAAFAAGLAGDAVRYGCPLSGGDTTRGALAVTFTLLGSVTAGEALRRDGAAEGDDIYVTGTLGDARAGLALLDSKKEPDNESKYLLDRYWLPSPRLDAARALRSLASSAIDISDGLLQDLGHIAAASGGGADVELEALPLSPQLRNFAGDEATHWALTGGDDYELCFTAPPARRVEVQQRLAALDVPVARIGAMGGAPGVRCRDRSGREVVEPGGGYDHFG